VIAAPLLPAQQNHFLDLLQPDKTSSTNKMTENVASIVPRVVSAKRSSSSKRESSHLENGAIFVRHLPNFPNLVIVTSVDASCES